MSYQNKRKLEAAQHSKAKSPPPTKATSAQFTMPDGMTVFWDAEEGDPETEAKLAAALESVVADLKNAIAPPPTKAIVLEGEVVLIEPDPDSTTQFTAFKTLMDIDPLPDDALVGRVKVTIEPLEGEGNE